MPGATVFYAVNIIKRKIVPTKATWIVWAILAALTAFSMFRAGAWNSQIVTVAVADMIVLFLAFAYGKRWEWTKIDLVCMAAAAISIVLWQWTGNPSWGIALNVGATAIGSVPILRAVWKDPGIERPLPWFLMVISSTCEIFALQTPPWDSWQASAQPITYLLIPLGIFLPAFFHSINRESVRA